VVDSLNGRLFGVWWFGWVVGLLVGCMVGCLVVLLAVKWVCQLVGELGGWNFVGLLFRRLISGLVCWSNG